MRGENWRFTITYAYPRPVTYWVLMIVHFLLEKEKKIHINEEVYIIQYELQLLEEYKKWER